MLELLILSLLVNASLGFWVLSLRNLVDRVHPRFLQAAERRNTRGVTFRKKAKK